MKTKLKIWTLIIISSLITEEIIAKMVENQREIEKRIDDISFTEVVTVSIETKRRTNEIDHSYKKPNKHKIIEKTNSSISSIMVTNGTVTWLYMPHEKSAKMVDIPIPDTVHLIAYAEVLNSMLNNSIAEYKGTEFIDNRNTHKIKLTPKQQQDNLSSWFWIDEETGLLLKTQTYEDDELVMTIEWRNIKINTGIQDSEFEIPEGVNVIDRDAQSK